MFPSVYRIIDAFYSMTFDTIHSKYSQHQFVSSVNDGMG